MGKELLLWDDETVERLGCMLVVSVVLRMLRNGWEEETVQEGMRSLGYDESQKCQLLFFFFFFVKSRLK